MTDKTIDDVKYHSSYLDPKVFNLSPEQDDETGLFQLFVNLWTQKSLILIITVIITSLGGLYTSLSTPVYQSDTFLLPPTGKDIVELKKLILFSGNTDTDSKYSSKYVYKQFVTILTSRQAKTAFFQTPKVKQYYMSNTLSELKAEEKFLNDLTIKLPKKGKSEIHVFYRNNSAQYSAHWLNAYIDFIIRLTKNQIIADLRAEIDSKKQQTAIQIASHIKLYSSGLEKELAKLNEALLIAKSLGITTPLVMEPATINDNDETLMIDQVRRLYRVGSHALEAEIVVLKDRQETISFVPGLTKLLQRQSVLNSLTVDSAKVQPVLINSATVNDVPVEPRKTLIIAISFFIGLIFAISAALLRSAIRNHRQIRNQDDKS